VTGKVYVTIFSVGDVPIYWWAPLAPLVGLLFGVALVWLTSRGALDTLPNVLLRGVGPANRVKLKALGWFLVILSVAWVSVASVVVFGEWQALRGALRTGAYRVVEGPVEDFKPMPSSGKGLETFRVRGVEFSLSDFEMTSGFHTTTYNGGPIREGLNVRIAYLPYRRRNVILRLEIAPTTSEASPQTDKTCRRVEVKGWG
jgi:hypothetical protein